jgi:uncharacterized membrane protein YdbT with pleckstrin-like domain
VCANCFYYPFSNGNFRNASLFCWGKKLVKEEDYSYSFRGQKADEKVIMVARRHTWSMAKSGTVILIVALIVFLTFLFAGASTISFYVFFGGLLISLFYGAYHWFVWRNDLYLLTNQRVIVIEQKKLFWRRVSEAYLEKIQDVTYESKGITAHLLNFGDVKIQTAGKEEVIVFEGIADPVGVQQKIMDLIK